MGKQQSDAAIKENGDKFKLPCEGLLVLPHVPSQDLSCFPCGSLSAESIFWRCRYENALQKANYASLALKQEQEQEQAADAEDEEELQVRPV